MSQSIAVILKRFLSCLILGGSWFDGYGWKICQCPSCKSHLGWMFEEIDKIVGINPMFPSEKGFYGIILDAVISESC